MNVERSVEEIIIDTVISEGLKTVKIAIFKKLFLAYLIAFAWLGGGILLTNAGYEGARQVASVHGSGSYVVWWGAIVYGIIRLVKTFAATVGLVREYYDIKENMLRQKELDLQKSETESIERENEI